MKKISLILLAIISMLLAGCSTTQRTAPIVDRNPDYKKTADISKVTTAKPVDVHGFYTVKKGDTLFHIALDFGQNYRDLVAWNNLENANDIKVDQVLRVLPPTVEAGGAQTSSIATTSGIEVRSLSATQPVQANAAPNKVGPLGNKQPYSETALLELQKPDAANYAVTALPPTEANPNEKAVDKSIDTSSLINSDDKNIAWMWPADGKVVATFDEGKKGIDIAGKSGQPVLAAGSGKVMYAGSGIRGYGNLVIVKHTNNLLSAYAYNRVILVKEGQSVSKGDKIAEMGNSDTDAVKLHFEIRQQGKPVDPTKFLPNR
ncbi:MAG TPA: peptidoglycan DD-metalloendopeptidase family protein [Burkholderiaceae bacterium]|jgi:lipoprotein NlpD